MIIKSYAKLNLYLKAINKRKDGFHNIETLFERISLHDDIILKPLRDKSIKIASNDPDVPKDNSNLCYQSAKLLQHAFNLKEGVRINIKKHIPVGAGLGGGSSNAAAALLGLNKLWGLGLDNKRLLKFAAMLGSDVPFFMHNCSFGLGTSRGEKIRPLKELDGVRLWHILAVPKISVSTPFIYEKWDKLAKDMQLTRPKYDVNILTLALRKNNLCLPNGLLYNSLESVTAGLYPEVSRIKKSLIDLGVKLALMSGSGPAVFGVVNSRKEAVSVTNRLEQQGNWRLFIVKTF